MVSWIEWLVGGMVIALVVFLLFIGFQAAEQEREIAKQPVVAKVVVDKVVEQRTRYFTHGNGVLVPSQYSRYYVVADDGTLADVPFKEYATARVGEVFASQRWQVPK
jgi:multidrug efflux pump subunit AcrA (membrane-fusion protein)